MIYQPYHLPAQEASKSFTEDLRWHKISQPRLPEFTEEPALESEEVGVGRESILSAIPNVGGYSTVVMAGTSPSFILKESASYPKVLKLRTKAVKNLSSFHTAECDRGFAFIDADVGALIIVLCVNHADNSVSTGQSACLPATARIPLWRCRMGREESAHGTGHPGHVLPPTEGCSRGWCWRKEALLTARRRASPRMARRK